jgi:hypothetical protein
MNIINEIINISDQKDRENALIEYCKLLTLERDKYRGILKDIKKDILTVRAMINAYPAENKEISLDDYSNLITRTDNVINKSLKNDKSIKK